MEVIRIFEDFKTNNAQEFGILLIGFFGSVAGDEATESSDVDIVKTVNADPFKIVHLKEYLETQLNRHVDIVRLRENMNPFLKERIEKEAIYV